jgi:hypothetical protein
VLYNVARGIQYPMLQAAGNLLTPIIAGNVRAVPFYLNPSQWPRRVKYLRNPETATPPSIIEHLEKVGLPRDPNLGRVSRDQIGARTGFNREGSHAVTKAIGTLAGNQRVKDLADSIDTGLRQAAFQSIWEPGYSRLKKDLVPMTQQRLQHIAPTRGVPLNVSRDQIASAIKQVESANGGYFNQTQLREALFEAFGGPTAANRNELLGVARRTAEDYHTELKDLSTLANIEVDRLAFSGTETTLDAALQRSFMFTWWIKNATRLYATSAAGSPVQMALWARAIEAENQRVREGTNPRFKSMTEFLKTPAGYTVSLNPMSLLGTFILGTSADPASPTANLTALGQFFGGGYVGENLILSPLIQAAGQVIGAFGQDYRSPDVLGTGRIEREIVDALNYVNQHWVTFHQTEGGNPERIPTPGFGPGMVNFLAQHISGLLPGTQKVAGYDPTAPAEGRMSALIAEQVLRDNPELDPADPMDAEILRRGIDLAMADHDSAHYQEALSRDVDAQYLGMGSTGEGGWRDVVGAVASHFVLPTTFSRQPTYRTDVLAQKGRDKLREDGATNLTPEGEIDPYEKMLGTVGARSPEGRAVELIRDAVKGDPQTMAVKELSDGIRYGDLGKIPPEGIDINGVHYDAEYLAAIALEDPEISKDLANDWIEAAGYRPILDQYYANKLAHMESNRAYADGEGLSDYAKQYPGGVDRFVDDTAAVNPNYKAFIEGNVVSGGQLVSLPEMRVTDHAQWVAHVTAYDDAKNVIAGIKDSRYGLEIDPKYAGTVAGISEPVGTWKVRTDAEEQAQFLANNPWADPRPAIAPIGVVGPSNPGPAEDWAAAPSAPALPSSSTPWYEQAANAVGGAVGSLIDATGAVVGTMMGNPPTGPGSKPARTSAPGKLAVTPAPDGMGVMASKDSDRTWMENMLGGIAKVTTDYKAPARGYGYQEGHGAAGNTHAAYDISCETGNCLGTPVASPVAGTVVCSGYGQGTGGSLAGCTYSQNTTNPGMAHTVVIEVGTDAQGNPVQLSFNHMGDSALQPGQQVNVGDPLGTMGSNDQVSAGGGPHIHLEGWLGDAVTGYQIVDPTLIVGGHYTGSGASAAPRGSLGTPTLDWAAGLGAVKDDIFGGAVPATAPADRPPIIDDQGNPIDHYADMPVSGGDWSVLDQFNDAYPAASERVAAETGVAPPPDLLKALNAMESGYGKVNPPTGMRDDLRNKRLAGFVGVFEDAADSWGADFERMTTDPEYAIYGMALGLGRIANWDAAEWGGSGTVLDAYGWDGVLAIYYSGQPHLDAPQPADDSTTVRQYVENINGMRAQVR